MLVKTSSEIKKLGPLEVVAFLVLGAGDLSLAFAMIEPP